ncbi:MAG TPA: DUF3343 domain-containing protein [Bacillota bacterium]|nr:DUF3343 domain-containing protein [Bacillota bacterium]
MRERTPKLVITFRSSTDAMMMDKNCPEAYGRLIPVPREISKGCGLAWASSPEMEDALLRLMEELDIPWLEKKIIAFY